MSSTVGSEIEIAPFVPPVMPEAQVKSTLLLWSLKIWSLTSKINLSAGRDEHNGVFHVPQAVAVVEKKPVAKVCLFRSKSATFAFGVE